MADEVELLCQEITRISNGGTSVTYGELARDDTVVQTFEALFGTLKAARKRGVLSFKGELLLMGQHDDVVITLTAGGSEAPVVAAPQSNVPAVAAEELAAAEEAKAPQPEPSLVAEEETADAAPAEATPEPPRGPPPEEPPPPPREAPKQPPQRPRQQQPRDGEGQEEGQQATPTGSKKWSVDTSYIDHRTADPDRLESRRSLDAAADPSAAVPQLARDQDGKWQQVDVSYINHRTAEVERLEGRRSSIAGAEAPLPSATVKKESDGKWKVDTSYIGHRTGDPDNIRKEGAKDGENYADPAETKYPYEQLKGVANRPADVDPTRKEQYLTEAEFQAAFGGATQEEFARLPRWKQQNLKKAADLY